MWVLAGLTLLLGFATDAFQAQEFDIFQGQVHVNVTPLWPFMCAVALGSGAAATAFVILATRKGAARHHLVVAWCAGVAVPLIPTLILALNRMPQAILAAVAWIAASALVVVHVNLVRRAPRPWLGLLLAFAVATPWLPVILINLRAVAALGLDWPSDPNELLALLAANSSVEGFAYSFALFFIAIMTAVGVALAAHSRSSLTNRLHRGAPHWGRTALLCLLAIAIVTIEVSGVGGLSSGFHEGYWGLRSPGTWPHAIIVAVLIAYVAERSWRSPLLQRGDVATTVVVGIGVLAGNLVVATMLTVSLAVSALSGTFTVIPPPVDHLDLVIPWFALAVLARYAVAPSQRGTAGQWVARVAVLYLVPVFVGITADRAGLELPFPFWATPAQVAICLVVIGCVATVLGLLGRTPLLHQKVASRVVMIPLIIVAGTSWLPTFVTEPLTPFIAVAAALVALLWAMPPVAADKERYSGSVLAASAQLLVVAASAAICASRGDGMGSGDPTMALLFFSVPLSALLCARVSKQQHGRPLDGLAPRKNRPTPKHEVSNVSAMATQAGMSENTTHAPQENAEKDPSQWVTGDEPMTGPQRSYLNTLAQEAGAEVPDDATKAQASELIDTLQQETGRGN